MNIYTRCALLYVACVAIAFLMWGCNKKTQSDKLVGQKLSFVAKPVPAQLPAPDVSPTRQDVAAAQQEIGAAQSDVRTVLSAAQKSDAPEAKAAVIPLTSADNHISNGQTDLASAQLKIGELEGAIAAFGKNESSAREAYAENLRLIQKDFDGVNQKNGDIIKKLAQENQELRDESVRSARNRLFWIGLGLIGIGVVCTVARFTSGFGLGLPIGGSAAGLGAFCITLSRWLLQIELACEIAVGVAAVALLAWLAYSLFKHVPINIQSVTNEVSDELKLAKETIKNLVAHIDLLKTPNVAKTAPTVASAQSEPASQVQQ